MSRNFTLLCALISFTLVVPSFAESTEGNPKQIHITADTITPGTEQFSAEGNARVTYEGATLSADLVSGDASTGDVEASGGVEFEKDGRKLSGSTFKYNFRTETGHATDARAQSDNIYFQGDELIAVPGKYTLRGSRFSTCELDEPHYYLSARELVLEPQKRFTAKDVRLVLYDKTILRIPRYNSRIGGSGGGTGMKLPSIGFGDRSGMYAGYAFDVSSSPETIGTLDVRLSTKWFLQGGFKYEQIRGKPFFARALYREIVHGGGGSSIAVTRLPEVGIRLGPSDMVRYAGTTRDAMSLANGLIRPLTAEPSAPRVNFVGEITAGNYAEEPSFDYNWRWDARGMAWLKPVKIGSNTLISPGVYGRVSQYEDGSTFSDVAFRLAAAQRLGEKSYVSLGYITHAVNGSTPFTFDDVDLKNELSARVGFPIGGYTMEIGGRYNLNTDRLFDTEVSLSKVVHCLEPKITWKDRFSELTMSVGIVGF